jgi:sugar transferase (PEP-CTERM/EpsH1 system associated)
MREFRPHIVHSRNWGAIEAIASARLAGVPVAIHSEHGYVPDMLGGLPRRQRLMRRALYKMADAVFTVTDELRTYHAAQAGVAKDRIRVIRNGVDTGRFVRRPHSRQPLRERFAATEQDFVVGTVSRLVAIKDHVTLLKGTERLISRGMSVRVLIAGSGTERRNLEGYVNSSPFLAGRVSFLGACDDVPELLNALDAFVLPSLTEGMSNTILEAMATGLPIVATRVGGNPELIQDGRSGLLFDPGDAGRLASHIETLYHDMGLRERLGAASRDRAVTEFSLNRMLTQYRQLYAELATRKGIQTEVLA